MADEKQIAQLKQLQADMNAAFESFFTSTQQTPPVPREIATAKQEINTLTQKISGTILGPAFSLISLALQPTAYAALRVALDLKVFTTVTKPTSLSEIIQKSGEDPDPVLLQRILRAVSSMGYLKQTARTEWEPTPLSAILNIPPLRDFTLNHSDYRVVMSGKLPAWLKARGYKTSGTAEDNVFTEVCGGPGSFWDWLERNPEQSALFDSSVTIQEKFPKTMRPPYPFAEENEEVTLVDIGGGKGQAVRTIQEDYPHLKGRFVLQDLEKTISKVDSVQGEGLELMVHDFFEPQTVKGAKYYHLRRILHDWNDDASIKILEATRGALTPGFSRLLICEAVLPDVACPYLDSMVDLLMMQAHSGMERTESQWYELLEKTGYKIVKIWRADEGQIAVIEAELA